MPSIEEARPWYPANDPVHGFDHVLRVYALAERLALSEGADLEIVHAAVLLHDANCGEQAPTHSHRPDHHNAAAELARQVLKDQGWDQERIAAVEHCIRAHRFRQDSEAPQTLEAKVLFDADKLDAIGAIGVARAIAYAACAGQPAYARPSTLFLQTGQKEENEPHSAYHEYLFKLARLKERLYTSTARCLAEQRHRWMAAFFERLAKEVNGEC